MQIVMYSTGCPKCDVLKKKLDAKSINYQVCSDVSRMKELGMQEVPVLQVQDELKNFSEAVDWINSQ